MSDWESTSDNSWDESLTMNSGYASKEESENELINSIRELTRRRYGDNFGDLCNDLNLLRDIRKNKKRINEIFTCRHRLEKSVVNKTVNFLMKNNSLYEKIKRNL